MDIVGKIIPAVRSAGIECFEEYGFEPIAEKLKGIHAFAGIKKIRMDKLRGGLCDVSAQVRVTVQAFGRDGSAVSETAEKTVIPAVLGCGEEIFCAEISETFYDVKTGRTCCEILFDVRRCGYDICS